MKENPLASKSQTVVLQPQRDDESLPQKIPDSPNFAALGGKVPVCQFPKESNDLDKDGSASSGELATDSDADGMEQAPDK